MKIHQWQIKNQYFTLVNDKKGKNLALKYIKNMDCVLDIGCGDCSFFDIINKERNNCSFYGFDVVNEALEICKRKGYVSVNSLHNIKIKFDVVTMFECFEHLDFDARAKQIHIISKLLKKNGYLIISFPNVKSVLSFQHYFDNPEHKIPIPNGRNLKRMFLNYEIIDKMYFSPWLNPIKIIHCIVTGLSFNAFYNNVCFVLRKK